MNYKDGAWTKVDKSVVRDLGGDAAIVFGEIRSYLSDGCTHRLTQPGIARQFGWSLRHVEGIIATLKEHGYISVQLRGPKGCKYGIHDPHAKDHEDEEDILDYDYETRRWFVKPEFRTNAKEVEKSPQIPAQVRENTEEIPANDEAKSPHGEGGSYNVLESKNVVGIPSEPTHSVRSSEGNQLPCENASASVSSAPKRPYADKPEPFRMYMAYCDALGLDTKRGYDPNKGKILGMARNLNEKFGYTAEDVYHCTKFLMSQSFRGEIIAFGSVYHTIGQWHMKGRPKEDRRRGEKINWQAGGTGRLVL